MSSLRYGYLTTIAVILATQAGCCCFDWGPAGPPCARTWFGRSCGCPYWSEWFSSPPLCRDKCNCCGDFTCSDNPYVVTGPTQARFGRIYDDGRRDRAGGSNGAAEPVSAPTPAAGPAPTEELPPMEPTTAVHTDEFGRTISYEVPIDSRRPSRKLGGPPARYAR
jgi:hypothetical protein